MLRMDMSLSAEKRSSSRRAWVSGLGLLLAASSLLGCSKKSDAATPAPEVSASVSAATPAPPKPFTAGFIYVGSKSDYGYNQAHAEGAKTLTAMGVKLREEENVPETLDVQKTMESMINLDG